MKLSCSVRLAGQVDWTIGYGISQSGRYTKKFILLGFNEDEDGRRVWDGADSNIAGAMGQFNIRFAQPGNIANIFEPGAEGPLWWENYNDHVRHRGVTGLLQRCRATHTCPKIFEDFGGAEIWYGRGSVGIAVSPEHGTEAEILVQRADVAMYVAKGDRSGCVVYALELDRHSPERLALMGDFRHAIARDELRVVYQPKINLRTREIFGVEALVRWQHPQRGLILPDRFIPMAEQTGAVRPVTLWMFERALQQCLEWRRLGYDLVAAVNLSPRNLHDHELPERVRGVQVAGDADGEGELGLRRRAR